MARKKSKMTGRTTFVDHSYEDRTYQIDPDRKKVYMRFVEIETAKASLILSDWRARPVGA